MTDPNMPSPDEGKPATETPTPNEQPDPATPNPAPVPEPDPVADPLEALRLENERLKQDYANSTREAQIILAREKDKDTRIEQLTKQHSPTDSELKEAYPEWDQMMVHEQRMAKENLAIRKRQAAQDLRLAEMEAQRKWEADLASARRTFPALAGREDDFRAFVLKPSHRTAPIDVLAKAYLMDHSQPVGPAPASGPTNGIQRGSAGPQAPAGKSKWTADQVMQIQKTDAKRYHDMLMASEFDDIEGDA